MAPFRCCLRRQRIDSSCRNFVGATRPHTPGFTFGRPKVNRKTAKTKVLDSLSQSVPIRLVTSLPLNLVLFLIYSGSIDATSASGPVKGIDVSIGACRNMVLGTQPREYP